MVFAAGNDASSDEYYPGFYQGAYAVAAVQDSHAPASFTNYGDWIDISAPGVSIYSTVFDRNGGETNIKGTSDDAPSARRFTSQPRGSRRSRRARPCRSCRPPS